MDQRLDAKPKKAYYSSEIKHISMPGKRKQVRTVWKADRKVQLAKSRQAKAKRLIKQTKTTQN